MSYSAIRLLRSCTWRRCISKINVSASPQRSMFSSFWVVLFSNCWLIGLKEWLKGAVISIWITSPFWLWRANIYVVLVIEFLMWSFLSIRYPRQLWCFQCSLTFEIEPYSYIRKFHSIKIVTSILVILELEPVVVWNKLKIFLGITSSIANLWRLYIIWFFREFDLYHNGLEFCQRSKLCEPIS